jgi:hypothetical protein
LKILQILSNAEAFDLAVKRGHFHAQQFCGTALIAAGALECIANEF